MNNVFVVPKCGTVFVALLGVMSQQAIATAASPILASEQPSVSPLNQNKCDPESKTPDICYIQKGTQVHFSVDDLVTTENRASKIGDTFSVSLISPVTIENHIIIPSGTKALGQVDYVDYKGAWGHNASLSVRLLYLEFSGRHIRLASTLFTKGKGGAWAVTPGAAAGAVIAAPLLPIAGSLSTGTSAKLQRGQIMPATIDEDVPVDMSDFHKK